MTRLRRWRIVKNRRFDADNCWGPMERTRMANSSEMTADGGLPVVTAAVTPGRSLQARSLSGVDDVHARLASMPVPAL